MKMKWFLMKVSLIFLLASASGKDQSSVVPYAINEMINEHFTKLTATWPGNVDIVVIGEETREVTRLINKLLSIKSFEVKIKVKNAKLSGDKKFMLNDSSIVLFDSAQNFKAVAAKLIWVPDPRKRIQHLVHVPGLKTSDISETIDDGFEIDHVNFLMNEDKKSIELVAGFMFTEHACRELQFKSINRFDRKTRKWENSIFYPEKYRNFHGCQLKISTAYEYNKKNGVIMKEIFEEVLNAKLDVLKDKKSFDDCEECDLTRQSDIMEKLYNDEDFIFGNPHIFDHFTFMVPPGEPYTDIQRMFMMFSLELWIAIVSTLLIGFMTTLSLGFVSRTARNFIVGRYVHNPTLNLVSIFLTGAQVRMPGRNFARFLVTLFIIWSLIIRTCHQSMLFELMQADLRKEPIKTLDELFESDLTLHDEVNGKQTSYVSNENFWERMAMTSTRFVEWLA